MNKKISFLVLVSAVVSLAVGCQSKPEPPPIDVKARLEQARAGYQQPSATQPSSAPVSQTAPRTSASNYIK